MPDKTSKSLINQYDIISFDIENRKARYNLNSVLYVSVSKSEPADEFKDTFRQLKKILSRSLELSQSYLNPTSFEVGEDDAGEYVILSCTYCPSDNFEVKIKTQKYRYACDEIQEKIDYGDEYIEDFPKLLFREDRELIDGLIQETIMYLLGNVKQDQPDLIGFGPEDKEF